MRLLLVRHGETVDNVAAVYAGVRDSALTVHGVLQASRLASYLATNVKISHIFSSDLQRAFKTAEAVRLAQSPTLAETVKLELLREQDFGYYEGKSYLERSKDKSGKDTDRLAHLQDDGFQDVETKGSMTTRMDQFVSSYLMELFGSSTVEDTVVVVAHGIILTYLWRCILKKFQDVSVKPGIIGDRGLEYLGGWSNTGYLDLEIKRTHNPGLEIDTLSTSTSVNETVVSASSIALSEAIPSTEENAPTDLSHSASAVHTSPLPPSTKLSDLSLTVQAVNSLEHLRGLKKTRGGIGSAQYDDKQKTMESFFKKQRTG